MKAKLHSALRIVIHLALKASNFGRALRLTIGGYLSAALGQAFSSVSGTIHGKLFVMLNALASSQETPLLGSIIKSVHCLVQSLADLTLQVTSTGALISTVGQVLLAVGGIVFLIATIHAVRRCWSELPSSQLPATV